MKKKNLLASLFIISGIFASSAIADSVCYFFPDKVVCLVCDGSKCVMKEEPVKQA